MMRRSCGVPPSGLSGGSILSAGRPHAPGGRGLRPIPRLLPNGLGRLLATAERGDAGRAIDVLALWRARVEIARHRLAATFGRIEIGVQHASHPDELKASCLALLCIEVGRAEQ